MKPSKAVGIAGYGVYIPRYRIPVQDIQKMWQGESVGRPSRSEKAVGGLDEDTVTIAIEAARNALSLGQVDAGELRAVWLGTESKPYAVKPSSTIVAAAIGASPRIDAADWEFACKAGTEAMQAAIAMVGSGMARYAMAIGTDTAQGRPADDLEMTTGAGGVAVIIGPQEDSLAGLEASFSFVTDTPDFFRREGTFYPVHGNRFTGEPAYFEHTTQAASALLEELGRRPGDYDYAVFHQPNAAFPTRVARQLGFTKEQISPGIVVGLIGNTYSASGMMGLAAVLDIAQPGQKIFFVSYGSGAGSDAFSFVVNDRISAQRGRTPTVRQYVDRRKVIDYARYARFRKKLLLD